MKKITTLMVMLVCCICSALAQTVASEATAPENIQDGYYMLLVKSADGKTSANGNYAYTENGKVMYDVKESENNFLGKSLNVDDFKYLFYVQKDAEGMSFHAWNADNSWWTAYGKASYASSWTIGYNKKLNPWQKDPFGLSDNPASFECVDANDFGSYLKAIGSKWEGNRKGQAVSVDIYITCNNGQQFGYWDNKETEPNNAQFKFYAVSDVPSASELVQVNYNCTFEGVSKKTVNNILAIVGKPFPEVEVPDYIATALPTGNVKAEDKGKTFEVVCTFSDELPFTVSKEGDYHYYYLDNAKNVRLYNNSGLKYRDAAQAEKINDIKNDLWYVTGNPFDGFQFYNVNGNKRVCSGSAVLGSTSLAFSGAADNTYNWYLFPTNDGMFGICPVAGSVYQWPAKLDDSKKKNYSWSLNSSNDNISFEEFKADNDAFRFQLTPATFTYTMYNGGDNHNYNTFSAPFDVKLAKSETDVKMYKGVADYEAKKFNMEEIAAAPAEAGIFLMGNNVNKTVTLEVTSGVAALEDNELRGSTTDVEDLEDKLILGPSTTTNEIGFFAAADGVTTLYANHAYLMRKTLSTVEGLSLSFGGKPTGIGHVSTSDVKNAPIYDLTGRRVNHTVKGQLYIQGGRKFIAR